MARGILSSIWILHVAQKESWVNRTHVQTPKEIGEYR